MSEKLLLDLQMFAEGGADGTGNGDLSGDFSSDFAKYFGSAKDSAAGNETETRDDTADEGTADAEADTPYANENDNEPDLDKEFEELIKGKFKDQFGKRTQGIINQRFKSSKETEAKYNQLLDSIAPLADKYGLSEGDIEGLAKAIKDDSSNFLQQALDNDSSVDAYRENFYANREKNRQAAEEETKRQVEYVNQKMTEWRAEEAELQKSYPDFSLEKECQTNKAFADALSRGTPVTEAYYGTNFTKLATGMVAAATQAASKKAAETIAANRARPRESGAGIGSGVTAVHKSVAEMGKDDILKILKQASRDGKVVL